jgi:hypothetical protein
VPQSLLLQRGTGRLLHAHGKISTRACENLSQNLIGGWLWHCAILHCHCAQGSPLPEYIG